MDTNKKKIDWKEAFDIFSRVSAWVVVPVVLALIAGKSLDKSFGTEPWIFLGLTGIAFLFSIFGIVQAVTKYIKKISPDIKSEFRPENAVKKEEN